MRETASSREPAGAQPSRDASASASTSVKLPEIAIASRSNSGALIDGALMTVRSTTIASWRVGHVSVPAKQAPASSLKPTMPSPVSTSEIIHGPGCISTAAADSTTSPPTSDGPSRRQATSSPFSSCGARTGWSVAQASSGVVHPSPEPPMSSGTPPGASSSSTGRNSRSAGTTSPLPPGSGAPDVEEAGAAVDEVVSESAMTGASSSPPQAARAATITTSALQRRNTIELAAMVRNVPRRPGRDGSRVDVAPPLVLGRLAISLLSEGVPTLGSTP